MAVRDVKELTVYIKAYRVSMEVFEISKGFPAEERYALTRQSTLHVTVATSARKYTHISRP